MGLTPEASCQEHHWASHSRHTPTLPLNPLARLPPHNRVALQVTKSIECMALHAGESPGYFRSTPYPIPIAGCSAYMMCIR